MGKNLPKKYGDHDERRDVCSERPGVCHDRGEQCRRDEGVERTCETVSRRATHASRREVRVLGSRTVSICQHPASYLAESRDRVRNGQKVERQIGIEVSVDSTDSEVCVDL